MPMEYGNLDEVIAFVRRAIDSFGFHINTGAGESLGSDLCEAGAKAIHDLGMDQQRGGKTTRWPENSDNPSGRGYRTKKERAYGITLTNVRTNDGPGSLLNEESLKGVPAVSPHVVVWKYGLQRLPSGGIVWADDLRRTDTEKAVYAHQQDRGFFEMGPEVKEAMKPVLAAALTEHLKSRSFK